jgi:RNA polymerase sigma-70 factor (ECF subfamily)
MVDLVDHDLVESARRGDRDAFAILVRTHGDRLFGIARRILRDVDLADEAVQRTFVKVWQELPSLREADRFEGWLTRILVRHCYELSRADGRRTVRLVSLDVVSESPTPDTSESFARRDQLEAAFRRLPPDQRAILVLRHYIGLEPTEIAATLGVPAGTVRSRLHYAHRELRAAIDADARLEIAGRRPA